MPEGAVAGMGCLCTTLSVSRSNRIEAEAALHVPRRACGPANKRMAVGCWGAAGACSLSRLLAACHGC